MVAVCSNLVEHEEVVPPFLPRDVLTQNREVEKSSESRPERKKSAVEMPDQILHEQE